MRNFGWILVFAALGAATGCGGGGSSSFATLGSSSGTTSSSTSSSGTTSDTYSMGNGTGTAFQSGVIGVTPATSSSSPLSAGGKASLSVTFVDSSGTLYTAASVTVTFSSPCIANGKATIVATAPSTAGTVADTVVTASGTATATYTATGCSPSDVITATALVGTESLSATATITIASSTVGSIQFVSTQYATIGLKGTGLNETSNVVFKVLDSTGAPKSGVSVSFALSTSIGGITYSPATATSASDGTVTTVVSSGTVHTTVIVTASIASPALSTQSNALAISTGLPTSRAFSIATTGCPNVEAYNIDGIVVPIVVRLSDRYQNPVPDGTAVAFTANGGQIGDSCVTAGGTGSCTVNWTSSNPRPSTSSQPPVSLRNGFTTILATAIGEESFTDISGTGYYNTSDPFSNLGEPYRDDNDDGSYDNDEYFLDFDKSGAWTPPDGSGNPANPPVGTFRGIICSGGTTDVPLTCTPNLWAIGAQIQIVMAEGSPTPNSSGGGGVQPANGSTLAGLGLGDTATYTFLFQVPRYQPR